MNNWADGLLVGDDDSAKFNDTGSIDFANGDNVDLVIIFGSIWWWCFSLMMPSVISDEKQITDFANFSFPNSTNCGQSL